MRVFAVLFLTSNRWTKTIIPSSALSPLALFSASGASSFYAFRVLFSPAPGSHSHGGEVRAFFYVGPHRPSALWCLAPGNGPAVYRYTVFKFLSFPTWLRRDHLGRRALFLCCSCFSLRCSREGQASPVGFYYFITFFAGTAFGRWAFWDLAYFFSFCFHGAGAFLVGGRFEVFSPFYNVCRLPL